MERAENFEMEDLMEDMIANVEFQHGETSFSEVGPMVYNLSTLDDQNSSMGEFQPIEDLNKIFEYMGFGFVRWQPILRNIIKNLLKVGEVNQCFSRRVVWDKKDGSDDWR